MIAPVPAHCFSITFLIVTGRIKRTFIFVNCLKARSIKSRSFSYVRLWGNVVYKE